MAQRIQGMFQADSRLPAEVAALVCQATMFLLSTTFVASAHGAFLGTLPVFVLSMAGMYWYWWRNPPPQEAGSAWVRERGEKNGHGTNGEILQDRHACPNWVHAHPSAPWHFLQEIRTACESARAVVCTATVATVNQDGRGWPARPVLLSLQTAA